MKSLARFSVLGAAACVFWGGFAFPASSQLSTGDASKSVERLLVTNSERIFVRVHGFPELSGEYRINVDDTVSIPVIGRTRITDMTPSDLEKALSKRGSELAGREIFVTVETVLYKPVYVTGLVDKPGAQQWVPGMTVLQATALAGGIGRSGVGQTGRASAADPVRLAQSIEEQRRALAAIAQLRAERDNQSALSVPDALVKLVGAQDAEQTVDEQRKLHESKLISRQTKLAAIHRAKNFAEQELAGLSEQGARVAEQLKLRKDSSRKLTDLQSKGVVVASRAVEEQIRVSELEEKATHVAVAIARIHATLASLDRDADTLNSERAANLDAEIIKAEGEAAKLQIEIDAARAELSIFDAQQTRTGPRIVFWIIRQMSTQHERLKVSESDQVRPSDVLIVGQE